MVLGQEDSKKVRTFGDVRREGVVVMGNPHRLPRGPYLMAPLVTVRLATMDRDHVDPGDQDKEGEKLHAESHYCKSSQINLYLNIELKWPISLCRWLDVSIRLNILCHISLGTWFVWNAQATPKVANRCRAANERREGHFISVSSVE